jgi:histidinol-phosphatase (PHP family)
MEEYIQKAIALRIDVYGFSEHAPMKNFCDGYRLLLCDKEHYETSINNLQEKYQDKIKILLGYEVDFLEGDYILDEIKDAKVDYLIGSVHYLDKWGFDNPEFIGEYKNKDIDEIWTQYFEAIEKMAESKLFQIVGHLDLIKVFGFLPKKSFTHFASKALEAIKESNMAVEINAAGFRKPIKEQYPSKELLELCFKLDIPITFSSDAHSVDQIGFSYKEVVALAKEVGYKECVYFENKNPVKVSI